jgi:hypothetical protein
MPGKIGYAILARVVATVAAVGVAALYVHDRMGAHGGTAPSPSVHSARSSHAAIPSCPQIVKGEAITPAYLASELLARGRFSTNELLLNRWVPEQRFATPNQMASLDVFEYDFPKLEAAERSLDDIDRMPVLRQIFQEVTRGKADDCDKWCALMDYLSNAMRHTPLGQPMHPDGTMVQDPLVLLKLGEGRCGHTARVAVDLALANGYEARLVQLACHVVAEVKWGGSWHCIDADADFPAEQLRGVLTGLPSAAALAKDPYRLDKLPARGWQMGVSMHRTRHGQYVMDGDSTRYGGMMLTSSRYFASEVFAGEFASVPMPRKGLIYSYKNGTARDWQRDRDYGWNNLRVETEMIPMIPLEYAVSRLMIIAPAVVYRKNGVSTIPVRFLPASRTVVNRRNVRDAWADTSGFAYEIRVSTNSRGWSNNFRNYEYMPQPNDGNVAVLDKVRAYDGGVLGVDLQITPSADVFIEVLPRHAPLTARGTFLWPSNEACVHVVPENRPLWTCRRERF